jgi:hypothetical protein
MGGEVLDDYVGSNCGCKQLYVGHVGVRFEIKNDQGHLSSRLQPLYVKTTFVSGNVVTYLKDLNWLGPAWFWLGRRKQQPTQRQENANFSITSSQFRFLDK